MTPQEAKVQAKELVDRFDSELLAKISTGFKVEQSGKPSDKVLTRWATIEPDLEQVRSIRPMGAPITGGKRFLLRLLDQYNRQITDQQTRFNLQLIQRIQVQDTRIVELEKQLEQLLAERKGGTA